LRLTNALEPAVSFASGGWSSTRNLRSASIAMVRKVQDLLIVGVALTVTFLTYKDTLYFYFHGDDFVAFVDLTSRPAFDHLWAAFTFSDSNFYWRPLGEVYNRVLFELFGLNPVVFHAGNLAIYLVTVALVYVFILRAKLGRPVAFIAALLFALTPAHVVGVAWVTNVGRLLAMAFLIGSLLLVQRAVGRRSAPTEVGAWLLFVAAILSDDTIIAMAPIVVLYPVAFGNRFDLRWTAVRGVAYGVLCASIVPLQAANTLDDEPRLQTYGLGWHMLEQFWALLSRLALPTNQGSLMTTPFEQMQPDQWTAGALTLAAGGLFLVLGSRPLRWLTIWMALAILPFAPWDQPAISYRYVYYAALPFSIMAAWVMSSIPAFFQRAPVLPALSWCAIGIGLFFVLGSYADSTSQRNAMWGQTTEPYRLLGERLPRELPSVPENTRLVIYYSVWREWEVWPKSVLRATYGRPELEVALVPRGMVESGWPARQGRDIAIFYTNGDFIVAPHGR
jgi:hypothetical protein